MDQAHQDIGLLITLQIDDWKSLIALSSVNKYWRKQSRNNSAWERQCEQYWGDKTFIPKEARNLITQLKAYDAFRLAYIDSHRTRISYEELIDLTWNFRFKKDAGEAFLSIDPWQNGQSALISRFAPNEQQREITTELHADPVINEVLREVHRDWRFVDKDGKALPTHEGCRSGFVRGTVNGADTPTYVVSRHSNWGFILQSCWVVFTSWDMVLKHDQENYDPELDDDNMAITIETQRAEAAQYNFGGVYYDMENNIEDFDDDDDDDDNIGNAGLVNPN